MVRQPVRSSSPVQEDRAGERVALPPRVIPKKMDVRLIKDFKADKCLYSKTYGDYLVIVCLYVDDVLILSDDMKGIIETMRFLSSTLKMKDLR